MEPKDMTTQDFEQAKREFLVSVMLSVTGEYNPQHPAVSKCLSDLTALISEGYVTKEKYMDDLCDEYKRGFEDGMDEARNTDRL